MWLTFINSMHTWQLLFGWPRKKAVQTFNINILILIYYGSAKNFNLVLQETF